MTALSEQSAGRKAVFLFYASQDAEAARRICESLRSAGVEVWFDQNELVGGDAWDGAAALRGLEFSVLSLELANAEGRVVT